MNAPTSSEPMRALRARPSHDTDPQETAEWRDAFAALVATQGPERARCMLDELAAHGARRSASAGSPSWPRPTSTPSRSTSSRRFPGDLAIEERLASLMRWNALAMVVRANQAYGELGGHIASYASAADLFEVGFNHFFHAQERAAPAATSCSSSRTARPASMRAPSSKAG